MPDRATPERDVPEREVLVIRGRLDRAGRFTPHKGRSTSRVRQWPIVEESDVVVELLDREQRVLHREKAQVIPIRDCEPGDAQRYRVVAHIELRDDASAVRLIRKDLELWRDEIPDAPQLEVSFVARRIAREKPVVLRVRVSDGGKDATLTVVYQWGARQFRPIYIGPPTSDLELDLAELPGGDACRFVVSYSNGMRSANAATEMFRVPLQGPMVEITRPAPRELGVANAAVVLQGNVRDDERPGGPREDDVIWLLNGEEIGRGLIAGTEALEPGKYVIAMVYRAKPGAQAELVLRVPESEVPTASQWAAWDPFDDDS